MSYPRRSDSCPEREPPPLADARSYTIDDARRVTGWSEPQLYSELKSGRVKTYTMGRRRFVEAGSLRDRIAELVAEAKPIKPEPRFGGRVGRRRGPKNYLGATKSTIPTPSLE